MCFYWQAVDKKLKKGKENGSLPSNLPNTAVRKNTYPSASKKASLTVEAACVLPLFLSFLMAFLYYFQAVVAAGAVAEGLYDVGKQMAVYAFALEQGVSDRQESNSSTLLQAGIKIMNLGYAKRQIQKRVGEQPSVHLEQAAMSEEEELIDLTARYRFRWQVPLFVLPEVSVAQYVKIRAWTGAAEQKGQGANTGNTEKDTVYVTVNGTVYHRDRGCTHIRLSVRQVAKEEVDALRNQDGGTYEPCESCGGGGSRVYITNTGDRYHSSVSCSGLKRGVLQVKISDVEGWKPCIRCGEEKE